MMYPILCKVRYESLPDVFAHREIWKQIGFSILINWIVAPFFMVCGMSCTRQMSQIAPSPSSTALSY
jgi:ACR3 family arsenite efflux pump ArsB